MGCHILYISNIRDFSKRLTKKLKFTRSDCDSALREFHSETRTFIIVEVIHLYHTAAMLRLRRIKSFVFARQASR